MSQTIERLGVRAAFKYGANFSRIGQENQLAVHNIARKAFVSVCLQWNLCVD